MSVVSAWLRPATEAGKGTSTAGVDEFEVRSMTLALSWGSKAGTCALELVADSLSVGGSVHDAPNPFIPGAYALLEIRGSGGGVIHRVHGLVTRYSGVDSEGGRVMSVEVEDLRRWLGADVVMGAYNIRDDRMVPDVGSGTVIRRRQYRHLLSGNAASGVWTESFVPMTAREIIEDVLLGPGVTSAWRLAGPVYHAGLNVTPGPMDWQGGVTLAAALTQVTEARGLVFTLDSGPGVPAYRLRWGRLGVVTVGEPQVPWLSAPERISGGLSVAPGANGVRYGQALSEVADRVAVVGDRNLYQVLNLGLVADWAGGWEVFWDEMRWRMWVYWNVEYAAGRTYAQAVLDNPADVENLIGWQGAVVAAGTITVGQFVRYLQGNPARVYRWPDGGSGTAVWQNFYDGALLGQVSRMDLPVVGYLRNVLYRAYRLPAVVRGRARASWEVMDAQLTAVDHDASGVMTAIGAGSDGRGYVIARGFSVGAEAFRVLNPDRFHPGRWAATQLEWTPVGFQIDRTGVPGNEKVMLDHPAINGGQIYAHLDGYGFLNAPAVVSGVEVRASLVLAGERYVRESGSGSPLQMAPVTAAGLHREFVVEASGGVGVEIAYADGTTADGRAEELAAGVLQLQMVQAYGSQTRLLYEDSIGTRLNGVVNRVVVEVSPSGVKETVDMVSDRRSGAFVPERDADRALQLARVFPGQEELRAELRANRALLRGMQRDPDWVKSLAAAFRSNFGGADGAVTAMVRGPAGLVDAGTPVWRAPMATVGRLGAGVTSGESVLAGVTVRHHERLWVTDDPVQVAVVAAGVAHARVRGAVAVGDGLMQAAGQTYLVKQAGTGKSVAVARRAVGAGETKVIEVLLGGGAGVVGGGGASVWV